jgi:hypothetical protein
VLDTEKMEWFVPPVSGVPPSARACHTTTLLGRKVYAYGGYDGARCFADLDVFDVDTSTWLQPRVSGSIPQARNAQTVTPVGSRLFLFGGHSGNKHLRDLHVLDTETLTWSQPDVSGHVPPGLRGHTANLVGQKVFVFGGYDGRGRSNDLFVLDTSSFVWSHPRAAEGAPTGRQRHTACLVGNKRLLVFGGFDGFRWLNDLLSLDVGKLEETAITTAAVSGLLTDLRSLVNNEDSFPDVWFVVQGTRLCAHKSILCARSAHFRAMFKSGMKESREREVPLPDVRHPIFVAVLRFVYCGEAEVDSLAADDALELVVAGDRFGLPALSEAAEARVQRGLSVDNAATLLSLADTFAFVAAGLRALILRFCVANFDAISRSEGFARLSKDLIIEVLRSRP